MKEGEATRKLKRALEEHPRLIEQDAVVIRHVQTFYTSGVPDLSVSVKEYTLWLELKMEGKEPTKLQRHILDRFARGAAVVTFSKDGKHAFIEDISMAGWLSFKELVEEIVSRCCENQYVLSFAATRGLGYVEVVSAGKVKP